MATLYGGSVEVLTGKDATGKLCDFGWDEKAWDHPKHQARYNVYDKDRPYYTCKRHLAEAIERDARHR